MRVKLFTFRYSASLGGFDDEPLARFTRDKEIVRFREHFFCVNEVPHLTCILVWQDAIVREQEVASEEARPRAAPARRGKSRPDPTEGLDERDRALFNTLREWRSRKAHDEGVPPYLILTNRHFLELLRCRPSSPTDLAHIDGIGPGKVQRYGAELIDLLAGAPTSPAPAEA